MLILNHPKEYGRRAEERLWRKVFYDVIQKLRNHRKVNKYNETSCQQPLKMSHRKAGCLGDLVTYKRSLLS